MKPKQTGLKSIPSVVQLPGGIVLKGLPFKILDYNADGSPKTFELLANSAALPASDPTACTLFANEAWIRNPIQRGQ